MEGYNHFSHTHILNHHQVPKGNEITCSGCKTPGTDTVYVCWQCSFFLHDYCYSATRSLTHPSHPAHPLTLAPYPTYPSKSFKCNSCSLIGTGFSFSCSSCQFDIHVHCAYNILKSYNAHSHVQPQQKFSLPDQASSFNPYQSILNSILPNQASSFDPYQSILNNLLKPETMPSASTQLANNPHQETTQHSISNLTDQLVAAELDAKIQQRSQQAALNAIRPETTVYKWKYDYV